MTTPTLHATPELVTTAWLISIVGDRVATTLPKPGPDGLSWADGGFVTHVVAGGSSNIYVPLRTPVMGVSCWAANPDSQKPPWGKASNLAETIVAACLDHPNVPRTALALPGGYPDVQVKSAYTVGDPRRITDDASSYARYDIPGLVIAWTEVTP
ncbi:hypothetical protein [Streptomyces sp. LN704]|uniref:hypothetical protein n=1 Tax=Streptomyces sp. LN704 TaxID=3112982 RepID=UPI0037125785